MNRRNRLLAYLLVPLLLFIITEAFFMLCNRDESTSIVIQGYILCLLMITFIYWLFVAITNNTKIATIIMCSIIFAFSLSNQIKIGLSSTTILVSDVLFLNTASTLGDILAGTLGKLLLADLPYLLFMIAGFVGTYFLAHKTKSDAINVKVRIIAAVSVLLVYIFMCVPVPALNNFMANVFLQKSTRVSKDNMANSTMKYYYKYGVFSGLYGLMLDDRLVEPDGYSEEEMNAQLAWADKNVKSDGSWGTPNIIMVFSESFFDIDKVTDIKFDKVVTPNFEKLKENNIHFDMITPSFGGISANVEYEMVTGGNLGYFSTGYTPFVQLYTNDDYYDAPSIYTELKNNGYRTKVVSTWESNLFNVKNVYDYFGIDEPLFIDDLDDYTNKGGRISEESVADMIINEFDNKKQNDKLFYMVLTAQAHMPYLADKYDEYDVNVVDSDLSDNQNDVIRSYAQGIYDADKQLGRLYDYIQTLDEPTIIMFYGDHLPFLKTTDGADIYKDLDYFNTDDELTNLYRKYNTECLILSNYELKDDGTRYLGQDLVMSYVFNKMDMKVSPFYKWLYSTKDTMASMNWYVTMDSKGKLYSTGDLPDNIQKVYDLRNCMNWKQFVLGR